jgi:hypothetical protein
LRSHEDSETPSWILLSPSIMEHGLVLTVKSCRKASLTCVHPTSPSIFQLHESSRVLLLLLHPFLSYPSERVQGTPVPTQILRSHCVFQPMSRCKRVGDRKCGEPSLAITSSFKSPCPLFTYFFMHPSLCHLADPSLCVSLSPAFSSLSANLVASQRVPFLRHPAIPLNPSFPPFFSSSLPPLASSRIKRSRTLRYPASVFVIGTKARYYSRRVASVSFHFPPPSSAAYLMLSGFSISRGVRDRLGARVGSELDSSFFSSDHISLSLGHSPAPSPMRSAPPQKTNQNASQIRGSIRCRTRKLFEP